MMKNKKATNSQEVIIHLILIILITTLFVLHLSSKIDSRYIKQQVLEKQTALLINSAIPGMNLTIEKANVNGYINEIKIEKNKVYIRLDGIPSNNGYQFISQYNVILTEDETKTKYIIQIK